MSFYRIIFKPHEHSLEITEKSDKELLPEKENELVLESSESEDELRKRLSQTRDC